MKRTKSKPKKRAVWGFSPITRVVHSKKVYSRKNITINRLLAKQEA